MNKLETYAEGFRYKLEKFMTGCDALEDLSLWNKAADGEMESYYMNDMVSMIISLIAADGVFADEEVTYLDKIFGFTYTAEELKKVYENCKESIESVVENGAHTGVMKMKAVSEKLADAYKELILTICDIVMESDGVIDGAEVLLAKKLKEVLE